MGSAGGVALLLVACGAATGAWIKAENDRDLGVHGGRLLDRLLTANELRVGRADIDRSVDRQGKTYMLPVRQPAADDWKGQLTADSAGTNPEWYRETSDDRRERGVVDWEGQSQDEENWGDSAWDGVDWENLGPVDDDWGASDRSEDYWENLSRDGKDWEVPSWEDHSWESPSWEDPNLEEPVWEYPSWENPSWEDPNLEDPSWEEEDWEDPGREREARLIVAELLHGLGPHAQGQPVWPGPERRRPNGRHSLKQGFGNPLDLGPQPMSSRGSRPQEDADGEAAERDLTEHHPHRPGVEYVDFDNAPWQSWSQATVDDQAGDHGARGRGDWADTAAWEDVADDAGPLTDWNESSRWEDGSYEDPAWYEGSDTDSYLSVALGGARDPRDRLVGTPYLKKETINDPRIQKENHADDKLFQNEWKNEAIVKDNGINYVPRYHKNEPSSGEQWAGNMVFEDDELIDDTSVQRASVTKSVQVKSSQQKRTSENWSEKKGSLLRNRIQNENSPSDERMTSFFPVQDSGSFLQDGRRDGEKRGEHRDTLVASLQRSAPALPGEPVPEHSEWHSGAGAADSPDQRPFMVVGVQRRDDASSAAAGRLRVWTIVGSVSGAALLTSLAVMYGWRRSRRAGSLPQAATRQWILHRVLRMSTEESDIQPADREAADLAAQSTPVRAKRLLERRGSNNSLTIQVQSSTEERSNAAPADTECPAMVYLKTAGSRLSRRQLRETEHNTEALHAEFWDIPLNFPGRCPVPGTGSKNRYNTIIPNEHSRVLLPGRPEDPLSTYINANWIRGYDGQEGAYIATQGPLPHTLADFWRMVLHHRAPAVVMITKLREDGRIKCAGYLPETRQTSSFGCVQVTVNSARPRSGYTVRHVTLQSGDERLELRHYWFTAWPDHQTPDQSQSRQLLQMAAEVEAARRAAGSGPAGGVHPSSAGPVVVHCSAGIGRTGCFIATSIGTSQLKEENSVDVLGIVCAMRHDRGGMVQTAEQYDFIHKTLRDFESSLPPIGGAGKKLSITHRHQAIVN